MGTLNKRPSFGRLRTHVTLAKFEIFKAQTDLLLALDGPQADRVGYSLTQMRSALEQLDNTLEGIEESNRHPGPRAPVTRVRSQEPGGSL